MKTSVIKLLSLVFCLFVCLCLIPAAAADGPNSVIASGTCHPYNPDIEYDVQWALYDDGLLKFTGFGEIANFGKNNTPWTSYADQIKYVEIDTGILSIGNNSFSGCTNLLSVNISDSVSTIGSNAFSECPSLSSVVIPDSVTSIMDAAFQQCDGLLEVKLPLNLSTIAQGTFRGCKNLEKVYFPINTIQVNAYAFSYCTSLKDVFYDGSFLQWESLNIINKTTASNGPLVNAVLHCAQDSSGVCGDGLRWYFSETTGRLSISGEGAINSIPWSTAKSRIKSIELPYGITDICDEAFYDCNLVDEIVIPSSVTRIGKSAFMGCAIKEISIPGSVTEIGDYAFAYCGNLNALRLAEGVITIGESAFCSCDLREVSIPSGVTSIKDNTFSQCSNLEKITLSSTVVSVSSHAFDFCYSITDVTLGGTCFDWLNIKYSIISNLNSIGDATVRFETLLPSSCGQDVFWTFDGVKLFIYGTGSMDNYTAAESNLSPWAPWRSSIKTVEIDNGVTVIGAFAFYKCNNLQEVIMPTTLERVTERAFLYCENLENVIIPDGVVFIGSYSFSCCSKLKSITIPNTVKTINDYAFDGADLLTDVFFEGSENQWREIYIGSHNTELEKANIHYKEEPLDGLNGYCGNHVRWHIDDDGVLTIFGNGEMFDFTYRDIPSYAQYCSMITKVCISDGVTYVGDYSFYSSSGFYYISSLTIADSVVGIGKYAFFGCSSPSLSITVSDMLTSVGTNAFPDGDSTSSSYGTIRSTVLLCSDDSYIASEESGYADWCLTESLCHGKAGRNIYYDFNLESRTLSFSGQGNLYESDFYFRGAYITQNIIFDSAMETATFPRLPGFTQVKEIVIPNGVLALPAFAFSAFRSLETVVMPNSITTIGAYAFDSCSKLSQITFSESLKRIEDNAFRKCGLLSHIAIPTSVEYIGAYSFLECKNLIHVKVVQYDDNIVFTQCSIKDSAFQDCENLVNVNFLETFTNLSLANRVFYGCKNLEDMNIVAQNLKVGLETFYSLQQLKTVEIHANHVEIKDSAFAHCDNLEKVCFTGDLDDSSFISDMAFDYSDEVVLYGFECSYVKEYADRNGIPFVSYGHVISLVEALMPTIEENGYYQYWKCALCEKMFSDEKGENEIKSPVIIPAFGKADFVLPSNLTIIEPEAFYGLSMCVVLCPDSLQEIQSRAFGDCRNLRAIYIPETTVVISDDAFGENSSLVIWGEPDSYAQEYAENRFLFVAFPHE